ncbi:tRNA (N(6)-L-threonylcarbamoyladenosine(37)-C(2))-methylthiotransferase MtaB [Parvularcula marina]|uniref:tRNA (N(6)-L-threonylcarbamoyladenosine(37)-C(2))- methylthiotransferase MtaB n=1 Tax=Parvularcula marina TaxID=2292771 RepID=UPI003514C943
MTQTPHIVSLGCRLNTYEAERMARLAREATPEGELVVINTCAVTGEAVRQSRQAIRKARRQHPDARILVSGCAVQTDPDGFADMPEISALIGNGEKLAPEAYAAPGEVADVFDREHLPKGPAPMATVEARAHLEVQNGCDHRCTFCIIPFGRGKARSKRPEDCAAEALELAQAGAREIVLTGVDLTSYGPDLGEGMTLADPIEALLEALPEEIGIRLSSIDGAEIDDRLFRLVTEEARIAPHLHLSLQAGDNMILKRMKRRHSREDAIALCQRLKAARPEIAFGADLIAGFPTETEEMFKYSLRLVEECGLAFVHVFPFSPRVGTPAAKMPQLPRDEVKARAARLRDCADLALRDHLGRHLGETRSVLVEMNRHGQAIGKLNDFTDIALDIPLPKGAREVVRISGHDGRRLTGEMITDELEAACG